jgi:hypothetical protein
MPADGTGAAYKEGAETSVSRRFFGSLFNYLGSRT